VRVLPDQQLRHVLFQVGSHRELTPVQRRIPDPGDTVLGSNPQGHKIPGRAGHEDFSSNDFHSWSKAFGSV
jgi:hypothetical protein